VCRRRCGEADARGKSREVAEVSHELDAPRGYSCEVTDAAANVSTACVCGICARRASVEPGALSAAALWAAGAANGGEPGTTLAFASVSDCPYGYSCHVSRRVPDPARGCSSGGASLKRDAPRGRARYGEGCATVCAQRAGVGRYLSKEIQSDAARPGSQPRDFESRGRAVAGGGQGARQGGAEARRGGDAGHLSK